MDDIEYERPTILTTSPCVLTDHYPEVECKVRLSAEFYRPATTKGPYPAVVVSEGLGGVKTARERRYGRFLAQNGFAAVVIDSFDTRRLRRMPDPIRAVLATESMMLADAFRSLEWLAAREDIDASRIYNIGFSFGGMICILTAYEQIRRHFVLSDARFAAHVSYYGPTVPRLEDPTTTGAPVAIMNGTLDKNFNPERAELIAGDLRRGGSAVENIVFENAYHQWDSDDHVRRFEPFHLHHLATRIDPDNTIYDERSGHRIKGYASRLAMIARSVSLEGYHLLRNEEIMRQSDEILLRYLTATTEDAGQADPPAAAAERTGRVPPPDTLKNHTPPAGDRPVAVA